MEKTTRHREKILLPAFVGFAVSGVISGLLILNYLVLDFSDYSTVRFEGRRYDVAPVQTTWEGSERFRGIQAPMRDKAHQDAYKTNGLLKKSGAGGVDVVVLSDSHGLMWAGVLDEIAAELKLNISSTAAARSPYIGLAIDESNKDWTAEDRLLFDRIRIARIAEWKTKLVLLLTRWSSRSMEQTHVLCRALQENQCRVLTIEPPAELFFGDNSMVVVLDGNRVLYVDNNHLSQDGALMAKDRIKTAIESELRQHSRGLQVP